MLEVKNANGGEYASIAALVDTGSSYTVLGEDLLASLGIQPDEREQFQLGDDSIVEWDIGEARLRLGGLERNTPVAFGPPGVSPLLGALTLQIFRLTVDPVNERLVRLPPVKVRHIFANRAVSPATENAGAVFGRDAMPAGFAGVLQDRAGPSASNIERRQLQPLVRNLMKTLLEDFPTLLDDADKRNLMNPDYCEKGIGLRIGGFALLCNMETGRHVSGHSRYWAKLYAGRFYVCNNWWKSDHFHNAKSLLRFATELMQRKSDHPGAPALERHKKELRDYIG